MTLTPQLRKTAIKKRASHPSSNREHDIDFRKLVDKLEQADYETAKNRKVKNTIAKERPYNNFTNKKFS